MLRIDMIDYDEIARERGKPYAHKLKAIIEETAVMHSNCRDMRRMGLECLASWRIKYVAQPVEHRLPSF